jgi:hypothetical protein
MRFEKHYVFFLNHNYMRLQGKTCLTTFLKYFQEGESLGIFMQIEVVA